MIAKAPEILTTRISADDFFLYKLTVEVLIDQMITLSVNYWQRGNFLLWTSQTWLSYAVQSISALLNDIALVIFLSPVIGEKSTIPTHMFERGEFTLFGRIMCWFHKFVLYFAFGGFTASISYVFGQLILGGKSYTLCDFQTNFLLGAVSLGVSSNTRYQLLSGIEQRINKRTKATKLIIAVLRFLNNIMGAYLWVLLSVLKYCSNAKHNT